jgi:hypothetical protein
MPLRLAHLKATRVCGGVAALATLAMLAFPGATLAGYTGTGGTIAKFTFSGELTGQVKVSRKWDLGYGLTNPGCEVTIDGDSLNLFLFNVKLTLNGHKTALAGGTCAAKHAAIELNVAVNQFGDTEPLANQDPTNAPDFEAGIGINLYAGRTFYSWGTNNTGTAALVTSGTVTTGAKGATGSFNATMIPSGSGSPTGVEGHATGSLTIAGSWTHCEPFQG